MFPCLHTFDEPHSEYLNSLSLSPDGILLVGCFHNVVKVWDLENRQQLCVLYGHKSRIDNLTISLDGKTIVSYAFNDSIKVWHSNESCRNH